MYIGKLRKASIVVVIVISSNDELQKDKNPDSQ